MESAFLVLRNERKNMKLFPLIKAILYTSRDNLDHKTISLCIAKDLAPDYRIFHEENRKEFYGWPLDIKSARQLVSELQHLIEAEEKRAQETKSKWKWGMD
jgi:hypothetical protein